MASPAVESRSAGSSPDGTAWTCRLDAARRRIDDRRIGEHLRRTEHALDRLRTYRERGEFPRNRASSERTPRFVGADGVPCALAFLMRADGRGDLVERVVATDPTVRVEELDDGPVLEWIADAGLTRAEAARIQPSYPESVRFATTCGPVACRVAAALVSLVALAAFAACEYVGYRVAADRFPDNALKRRGLVGYLTVANVFLAALLATVLYALFP